MTTGLALAQTTQSHEVVLAGCQPEPLLSYLKALGALRLVAEQADQEARGFWRNDRFHLVSTLDEAGLMRFFEIAYKPTPLLSPWNNGSGFYGKDGNVEPLMERLLSSTDPRLAAYREAATIALPITEQYRTITEKEKRKKEVTRCKDEIIRLYRNRASDIALLWLDAAVVLTGDRPSFPPILGSGGNDGNFEFTANFLDRLSDAFSITEPRKKVGDGKPKSTSDATKGWLRAALLGDPGMSLLKDVAVGQYSPGGAGGPNAGNGFNADSLVNPWDFVLAMEGAVLLAASVVRRFSNDPAKSAAAPFTVDLSTTGYASATARREEPNSRAELWMPLWERATGLAEIQHLFAEGRARVGSRSANNGLDFARAVASLGIDRGISGFVRYGLLQRNGRSYLATPLGRMPTRQTPVRGIDLLGQLDTALQQWNIAANRAEVDRYAAAIRAVERTMFALAAREEHDAGQTLLRVLAAVGHAASLFSILAQAGRKADQPANFQPLQGLTGDWLVECANTVELRLAAALAGMDGEQPGVDHIRHHLEPVRWDNARQRWTWSDTTSPAVVWSEGPITQVLERILARRCLDAAKENKTPLPLRSRWPASLVDIDRFLRGEFDEQLLADLLWAICGVSSHDVKAPRAERDSAPATLPRAYAQLKLLFLPHSVRDVLLPYEPNIIPLLRAYKVSDACKVAARRLRARDLNPLVDEYVVSPAMVHRLAAALVFPVGDRAVEQCARMVLNDGATASPHVA